MRRSPLPPLRVLEEVARRSWPGGGLRHFSVHDVGWTNLMLEADHRLMFRFPRWTSAARSLGTEVRLLEFLANRVTTPIPRPILIGTMDRPRGWPFFVYEKLPGTPLTDLAALRRAERERLARFLGRLFRELASCRPASVRRLGLPPGDRGAWETRFRRLETRFRRVASERVPAALSDRIAELFRGFFATLSESRFPPTLLHADLWPSHILWSRTSKRPAGVIDWEDARLGDPAFDLAAFGGIGDEFSSELISDLRSSEDDLFERRLLFYRRILPLPGLLFGLETRQRSIVHAHLQQLRLSVALPRL